MIMVKYLQKSTTSPSFDVSGTVCPAADIPPEMFTATTVGGASSSGRNPTRKKRQALCIISSQNVSSFVIRSQWHDRCVHTTESPYMRVHRQQADTVLDGNMHGLHATSSSRQCLSTGRSLLRSLCLCPRLVKCMDTLLRGCLLHVSRSRSPSGETPISGYSLWITNPESRTENFTCSAVILVTQAALAYFSCLIP